MVCFSCYCGVSSGVSGWSCVVVLCVRVIICFCHLCHCCLLFPCLPHLGEPFLLFTLFFFYFLLERGPIGKGLLSRRLVRRRRWRLKGNLCSFCLLFKFSFFFFSYL